MNHVKRIMIDCECVVGQHYSGCRELLIKECLKTTIYLGSEKKFIYLLCSKIFKCDMKGLVSLI